MASLTQSSSAREWAASGEDACLGGRNRADASARARARARACVRVRVRVRVEYVTTDVFTCCEFHNDMLCAHRRAAWLSTSQKGAVLSGEFAPGAIAPRLALRERGC